MARDLAAERSARIREQERAEVAAHVHDSVLHTLTLIQRHVDDPREVARLARAQERELRGWLYRPRARRDPAPRGRAGAGGRRGGGRARRRRSRSSWSATAPLDDRLTALRRTPPGRRWSTPRSTRRGAAVSVYAEVEPDRSTVFVRDRGPGFDPDAVPEDRLGLRQSVRGRMDRNGGTATVRSHARGRAPRCSSRCPGRDQERAVTDQPDRPPGPVRVVLVDDHRMFRSGVRAELAAATPVEVVGEAEDAQQAVSVITATRPDVVLLDVHLPGGGGRAVLQELVDRAARREVPRAVGQRRTRGRDRGGPRRCPRLRHQVDHRAGAGGRRTPGGRRRRGVLAAAGRLRAGRVRGHHRRGRGRRGPRPAHPAGAGGAAADRPPSGFAVLRTT